MDLWHYLIGFILRWVGSLYIYLFEYVFYVHLIDFKALIGYNPVFDTFFDDKSRKG